MEEKTPAPITAVSVAIANRDIDDALWRTAALLLHAVKSYKADSKEYLAAVIALGKLFIDIKKSIPPANVNKEALLQELLDYVK